MVAVNPPGDAAVPRDPDLTAGLGRTVDQQSVAEGLGCAVLCLDDEAPGMGQQGRPFTGRMRCAGSLGRRCAPSMTTTSPHRRPVPFVAVADIGRMRALQVDLDFEPYSTHQPLPRVRTFCAREQPVRRLPSHQPVKDARRRQLAVACRLLGRHQKLPADRWLHQTAAAALSSHATWRSIFQSFSVTPHG